MITYVKARPTAGADLIDIGAFDNRRKIRREPDETDLDIKHICDQLASLPPTTPTLAAEIVVYARTPLRSCQRSIDQPGPKRVCMAGKERLGRQQSSGLSMRRVPKSIRVSNLFSSGRSKWSRRFS